MKLGTSIKRLLSFGRGKAKPRITLSGVTHKIGNKEIGQSVAENVKTHDVLFLEGSLYLGGFIPENVPRDKVLVFIEPPTLFFSQNRTSSLSSMYLGGRAIPDEGRGPRRMFETIASDLEKDLDRRELLGTVNDLLTLRAKLPDVVVYNEPEAWLRTVWYESDLMFQYVISQREFPLFGAFIYSEMDASFGTFLEQYGNAVSAMTANDALLFSFDGKGGRDSELHTASQYVAYRSVLETPHRFEQAMKIDEIERLREQEARMLTDIRGVNRSLLFGRRLGIQVQETPCIVFWHSLEEKRVVSISLATYPDDEARIKAMKSIAGIVADAVTKPNGNVMDALAQGTTAWQQRVVRTDTAVGDIVRGFLKENAPPLRDRLSVEDIDSFERVRSVHPSSVAGSLNSDGYLDLPEDVVQDALEKILNVPFHKKDWGGETNDLYTANVVVNGVRISTAFLLKGNGLKRKEMRIADCGKNGDQLLRLFESPAYLFVVQFVGQISEAVIADVQGKVAQLRSAGKPAWFLIMDGLDTARLMHAYGKLPGSESS